EQCVHRLQSQGQIETVIIRPPWFYGPYQPPRQTRFFRMIRDGKMPLVGRGYNRRSMAYIDNIVQGLLLAAEADRAIGETYWIADARPYAMTEIIETVECLLEQEFGQKCAHRRLRLPRWTGDVARLADGLVQMAGRYNQSVHVLSEMNGSIACSIRKAE